MSRPRTLLHFARETIQKYSTSKLPWSSAAKDIRSHYVELRVADSSGTLFPVGELLHQGARLVLVGDPGSGKTTALREFAVRRSEDFVAGKSDVLPIYVSLREAFPSQNALLLDTLPVTAALPVNQQILLLLDGLDEIRPELRSIALSEIDHASKRYPNAQVVLASRPTGLSPPPPDEFRFYHLESLNSAQVLDVIDRLAEDKAQADAFRTALSSSSFLEGLSRSPLLIQLIWQVFQSSARLPQARAELYRMACDLLLYNWDAARGISRERSTLTLAQVNDILSATALEALSKSLLRIPTERVKAFVSQYVGAEGAKAPSINSVVAQLMSSGLLIELDSASVSFPHLSFMEFYAARHLSAEPRRLASLIAEASPHTKEIVLFAAGMVTDVAPLVEAAVDRRELILAATCLREGLTENRTLEAYVLDQLRRELGSELVRKLAGSVAQQSQPSAESIHSQLLRLLLESRTSTQPAHQKGKLFENFVERLFRQCFDIVGLNTNTENGEIDIILGNVNADPFWAEWGGDILVECKNWSSSRPLKETAAFAQKVRMSRGRLGFFVSMGGFTEDAIRTLRNQVADREAPLIVPISGADVESMLNNREKFDPFFRRVIRSFKHLNKW